LGTLLHFVQKTTNLFQTGQLYPALRIKTDVFFYCFQ